MGRNENYDYEELSTTLFEKLVDSPDGMTMEEIVKFLDVQDRSVATKVITTLRLDLGEGDTITVPVIRDGALHKYILSGVMDDSHDWLQRRARFLRQFVKTETAALGALARRVDGRSKEGRALRMALTDAVRLEEDLAEYLASVDSE